MGVGGLFIVCDWLSKDVEDFQVLWEWHWTLEVDLRLSEVSFYLFVYYIKNPSRVELDLFQSVSSTLVKHCETCNIVFR